MATERKCARCGAENSGRYRFENERGHTIRVCMKCAYGIMADRKAKLFARRKYEMPMADFQKFVDEHVAGYGLNRDHLVPQMMRVWKSKLDGIHARLPEILSASETADFSDIKGGIANRIHPVIRKILLNREESRKAEESDMGKPYERNFTVEILQAIQKAMNNPNRMARRKALIEVNRTNLRYIQRAVDDGDMGNIAGDEMADEVQKEIIRLEELIQEANRGQEVPALPADDPNEEPGEPAQAEAYYPGGRPETGEAGPDSDVPF